MPRVNVTFQLRDGGESHGHVMNADGTVGARIFDSFDWMADWTTVRAFSTGADPFLFLLNAGTGDVAIHELAADIGVGREIETHNWTSGWTTASFYTIAGTTFLFLLKRGNGVVHIHRMNADGTVGDRVENHDWSAGWTTAEPFTVGGSPFLFLLKESNGSVHIHRLNTDGTVGGRVDTADWSRGWTSVRFYVIGGTTYLFLLKASNGTVHTHRMNPDGSVGARVETFDWSSGWTTVEPFEIGGSPFLFLLKESNGVVHTHALRNDGTVGERVDTRDWSRGWADAVFYTIGTTTFLLLNKQSARRPLRRTFVEHLGLGVPIGLYRTNNQGQLIDNNGDLGLNSLTSSVDLRVLCHNSVARLPNGLIDHWIDVSGAADGATVVLSGDVEHLDRFRIGNRAVEAYDRVFRQFDPFEDRGDFPLREPSSLSQGRDRKRRIEITYPDGGLQPLAFVEPKGLTTGFPVIHIKEKNSDFRLFGGNGRRPTLVPGELAHAVHFSLLSESQRDDIASNYVRFIAFDLASGGEGTHELDRETDPTVAFIESLDHFATRFTIFLQQNPARPIDTQLRRDFVQHELDAGIVATLDGALDTGTITPNAGLSGSSIEGAVYGAIFLDLARRPGVGLRRAVRAFFDSKVVTYGQFRRWVDDKRPELSAPLAEVSATWGM